MAFKSSKCDLSGELTVLKITVWCLQKLGKDWLFVNKEHKF